jgi:hypothetical protein
LNHEPGDAINPPRPLMPDANALFYFRFRDTAEMPGPAAGLVPVENDPQRTKLSKHKNKDDCDPTRTCVEQMRRSIRAPYGIFRECN